MIEAPLPDNEAERLAALLSYEVLDTDPEQAFDDLTELAARVCEAPIALVSLIDAERQWFKSRFGLDADSTPRRVAFCAHSILDPEEILVVPDAHADPRFADNPLVTGAPQVRAYVGAPLVDREGMALGTLCVIDHKPRTLDDEQLKTLRSLARQVASQLSLRRTCRDLIDVAKQLEIANRELSEFTSIAAHDLHEPARKLISFSSLLRDDLGDALPPRAAEDIGFITDAAKRMQSLIDDLLRLSRTGSASLQRESVPLEECVSSALQALSMRIDESGAEVTVERLPTVHADRTLLTQLFQNLIGNALKFVDGESPRIRITCGSEDEDGATVFGVQDNGIGIEADYADQIFSPFKRLHGRTAYEGTGIGLAIARKSVERHGGRIWIESQPGVGSHFKFTLGDAMVATPV